MNLSFQYYNCLSTFLLAGLVVILTVPALYERYEDYIDLYVIIGCRKMQQLYVEFDSKFVNRIGKWILERQKLSWFPLFLLQFSSSVEFVFLSAYQCQWQLHVSCWALGMWRNAFPLSKMIFCLCIIVSGVWVHRFLPERSHGNYHSMIFMIIIQAP